MNETKHCCEPFGKILSEFKWFSFVDEKTQEKIFVMPYIIGYDGEKYRVNHCPVCGSNVRDIKIT